MPVEKWGTGVEVGEERKGKRGRGREGGKAEERVRCNDIMGEKGVGK